MPGLSVRIRVLYPWRGASLGEVKNIYLFLNYINLITLLITFLNKKKNHFINHMLRNTERLLCSVLGSSVILIGLYSILWGDSRDRAVKEPLVTTIRHVAGLENSG